MSYSTLIKLNKTMMSTVFVLLSLFGSVSYSNAANSGEEVEAIINVDNTNICIGSCLEFFNESTGDPTLVQWTIFGITASGNNLLQCFNNEGDYDIKLKVENDCSADSLTITIKVRDSANGANLGAFELCDNQPLVLNGESFNQAGIYVQNLINQDGCDSTLLFEIVECSDCNFEGILNTTQIKFKKISEKEVKLFMLDEESELIKIEPIAAAIAIENMFLNLDGFFGKRIIEKNPHLKNYINPSNHISNNDYVSIKESLLHDTDIQSNQISNKQARSIRVNYEDFMADWEDLRVGSTLNVEFRLKK